MDAGFYVASLPVYRVWSGRAGELGVWSLRFGSLTDISVRYTSKHDIGLTGLNPDRGIPR